MSKSLLEVAVEWAVHTKQAGDTQDYRITASSSREADTLFETTFRQYPLNLPSRATDGRPRAGVTFAGVNTGGTASLLCLRYEETAERDGRGRPIVIGCAFLLPYAQLAPFVPSYASIFDALPPSDGLRQGQGRATLRLTYRDSAFIARAVERCGFDFSAAGAAALFYSRVAITSRILLSLEDRLQGLDAIVSLLPFGARAGLSCSTWNDSAGTGDIRLVFSDQSRADQLRLVWGDRPAGLANAGEAAEIYRGTLSAVRVRYSIQNIVDHLAAASQPYSFDEPQALVSALQALDEPYLLWRDVSEKRKPEASRVRGLITQRPHKFALLEDYQQKDMLAYLLGDPLEEKNLTVLRGNWRQDLAPELRKQAVAAFRTGDATPQKLTAWLRLALDKDFLDDVVVALWDAAGLGSAGQDQVERSKVTEALLALQPQSPAPFFDDKIRDYMIGRPILLYELFIILGRMLNQEELRGWLEWAEQTRAGSEEVTALRRLLDPSCDFATEGSRALDCVAAVNPRLIAGLLLTGGGAAGRAAQVASWILARAKAEKLTALPSFRSLFEDTAFARALSPADKAKVDLAVAIVAPESSLPYLRRQIDRPASEFQLYLETLQSNKNALNGQKLQQAVQGLFNSARELEPMSGEAFRNLLRVLSEAVPKESRPKWTAAQLKTVCDSISVHLARFPGECESAEFRDWETDFERAGIGFRIEALRMRTAIGRNALTIGQLGMRSADVIAQGQQEGLTEVLEVVRSCALLGEPEAFDAFLGSMNKQLLTHSYTPEAAQGVEKKFLEALCAGKVSTLGSQKYRDWLIRATEARMIRLSLLLETKGPVSDAGTGKRLRDASGRLEKVLPRPPVNLNPFKG